jgi:hypothetical protein
MTRLKLLGAAALMISSALASPAMARHVINHPGYCGQSYPNTNCQNNGVNKSLANDYQRRAAYQSNQSGEYKQGKGDWSDNRTVNRRSDSAAYQSNQGIPYKQGKGDWSDLRNDNQRNNEAAPPSDQGGLYKHGKGDWSDNDANPAV